MKHLYPAQSEIAGIGVFAARDYEVGEWILSFSEGRPQIVSYLETTHNPDNFVQIGIDECIYPQPPALYLNHSCDPNVGVRRATEVIALKRIAADSEITFDYSTCIV